MNPNAPSIPAGNPIEEDAYKLMFLTAAEGLLLINTNGQILLANKRAEEMFGYSAEELLSLNVDALVPDAARGTHKVKRESYHSHPVRRSMGIGIDLSARRKDGTSFPVEISLNHTISKGEQVVMALITDITQRKAAEFALAKLNTELEQRVVERTRELKESQRLYSLIARNFPNGTINVFDHELNYVFVEGRELFKIGVTSEQLVGTHYLDRLPPEIALIVKDKFKLVFEGEDLNFQVEVGTQTYELHCVGLDGSSGQVHHILVVEHDITQQKKAEVEIRNALAKERELNELKSRFVSMASHEFRTPLSTILTSLALAQRYESPEDAEKRQKHFLRIKASVHNLTGILNDFLSFDKLETGHISTNLSEFDLDGLLAEIAEEMQAIAKTGQAIMHYHANGCACFLDAGILRNVLVNLVSNAIKYSAEGKEIWISAHCTGDRVQIKVIDQGIGIPKKDQVHMFQRFFRAQNATNIQGTGLGLTIVQKYLDLLGGEVWFDSEEGVGTTFTIELPQRIQV